MAEDQYVPYCRHRSRLQAAPARTRIWEALRTNTRTRAIAAAVSTPKPRADQRWASKLDDVHTNTAGVSSQKWPAAAQKSSSRWAPNRCGTLEAEQAAAETAGRALARWKTAVSTERAPVRTLTGSNVRRRKPQPRRAAKHEASTTELHRAHADLERARRTRARARGSRTRQCRSRTRAGGHERTHADRARAQADLERVPLTSKHTKEILLRVHVTSTRRRLTRSRAELAKEIRERAIAI